jgi:hypothetical protein
MFLRTRMNAHSSHAKLALLIAPVRIDAPVCRAGRCSCPGPPDQQLGGRSDVTVGRNQRPTRRQVY